jgi:hypothetical protein
MGTSGGEVAAAQLEVGAQAEGHVRVVGGDRPQRLGGGDIRPVPVADGEQGLDAIGSQDRVVHSVGSNRGEPLLSDLGRLCRPSEHRQHVGERDVDDLQRMRVTNPLGELQCLAKPGEALVGAAEIREVAAQRYQHSHLDIVSADHAREFERLLAGGQ